MDVLLLVSSMGWGGSCGVNGDWMNAWDASHSVVDYD